jgi:hypothetical protein
MRLHLKKVANEPQAFDFLETPNVLRQSDTVLQTFVGGKTDPNTETLESAEARVVMLTSQLCAPD